MRTATERLYTADELRQIKRFSEKPVIAAQLTMGDIGSLVHAVDHAIAFTRTAMDSELPPNTVPRSEWAAPDLSNYQTWRHELKIFRAVRRKLIFIEKRQDEIDRALKSSRCKPQKGD